MAVLLDPEGMLDDLHPDAAAAVRRLVRRAPAMTLRIRSGRRTCRQQYDLYGIGRRYNLDDPVVTYADGCRSWHVLARAVDVDVLDAAGKPVSGCEPYERLGALWESLGGVWGGRWKNFGACGDAGHFEWHPGLEIADLCPDPAACDAVSEDIDLDIASSSGSGIGAGIAAFALTLSAMGAVWWHLRSSKF